MPRRMTSKRREALLILMILMVNSLVSRAGAASDSIEAAALLAFKNAQLDPGKKLSNWQGNDPCGSTWQGIYCQQDASTNVSYVIEIRAMNYNLQGTLVSDLGNLTHLMILNLMNNGLTGKIPAALGKLTNLKLLLLNNNKLAGQLPPELSNLGNMTRFQVNSNQLSGSIPVEFGNLANVHHLHMNNNSFTGTIPSDLGRLSNLNHLILDYNQVTGPLPAALANISQLTIVQLDYNPLGVAFPQNWTQIPTLIKLSMRNTSMTGFIPDLGGLPNLTFIDMSNNALTGSLPSNVSSLMTTLAFSNNQLTGNIPTSYGALNDIQNLDLSNNNLNGTTPDGLGNGASFQNSSNVVVVDLQNNNLSGWTISLSDAASLPNKSVWLTGNNQLCGSNYYLSTASKLLVCSGTNNPLDIGGSDQSPTPSGSSCPSSCNSPAELVSNVTTNGTNGRCWCAVPITVMIRLKAPGFTYFSTYLALFEEITARALNLSDYQVRVSNATRDSGLYAQDITLLIFPAVNTSFTDQEFENLYSNFSSWTVSAGQEWSFSILGPYDLLSFFTATATVSNKGSLSTGAIVGIVVGSVAVASALAALLSILFLCIRWKNKGGKNLELYGGTSLPPGVVIKGVKGFTFAEIARATNGFSQDRELGQGGYGKVYKGVLDDGTPVAIKRAHEGSMQGATQFYTEIAFLSRVHHRNLLSLVGFCNDGGEQMLVYEFMAGGTLRDHLKPTEVMDFARRMHIALGTARGIKYLHTEADPPIFHRDIKASNILLDERYNAKVADFGLSKLAPIPDLNGAIPQHVSTIVKGTPGYLDPEYFMTQQLTDKTDVYSFGVVLLEIITGMQPISYGKNIVREVTRAMQEGEILSIADPQMGTFPSKEVLEPLLRLALACCQSESATRPSMVDIVRELDDIWRITKSSESGGWKEDSQTFSIDMDRLRGLHLGEPSSDSYQDVSSDTKGETQSKIDPR